MKAIVYRQYGPPDVLRLEEIEKPVAGDDEVLIKVRAASVNPYDWHFMRGSPSFARLMMGFRKPRSARLGVDMAGEVEATGKNATQFKPGDAVFGYAKGAFAEYVCAKEAHIAPKPARLTFEQAGVVAIAAFTASAGLRRVQSGQSVLINGAAGGVGTFAVQMAKAIGAEVTGVCSTRNVEMVRSIGAGHVIDYTRDDFTKGTQRYDAILDCIGNHSYRACRKVLKPKGLYLMVGGKSEGWIDPLPSLLGGLVLSLFSSQKLVPVLAKGSKDGLNAIRELLDSGKITPVIDRTYELSEVPQAIAYSEEGHARGKIAITVTH